MIIKNNFSVDDIHAVREEQTKMFNSMSNEELKKYFREQEKIFYNEEFSKKSENDLVLA